MAEGELVYVYGISAASRERTDLQEGIAGAAVRPVEHVGLAALTSRLGRDSLSPKDVRAHWRVLERAFADGTVLPLRFGTVMEGDDAVRERLLGANAERLSALLRDMTGLVQLNVKGLYQEEVLLREIVRASPDVAALRDRLRGVPTGAAPSEQLRLGQLVEAEIERRRAEDTAIARDRLEPLAVTARQDEARHPVAFDLAFLVEGAGEGRFSEAVSDLGSRLGERVRIRYVGPMPPFSFADTELRSEAWA